MLKKSSILLSCHNWHPLCPSAASKTSSIPPRAQTSQRRQTRSYAMVSDGYSRGDHGKLWWPEVTSANKIPTPYQIFNQKKGSPYSKERFYELVKLYHPDRHDVSDGLSYDTKLERYRLVVAANDLLSDPVKRGAYDCYGAGWNGAPDVRGPSGVGRGWRGGPNGPSRNATWEDWEKWYAREAGSEGPQEPRFVSNAAFVGLILIFAVLGGIGQATRVGNYSMTFLEQRDALHDTVSKDLRRRRKESKSLDTREEQIHNFLKNRDPVGYGIDNPKAESYRRLLPAPEVCSSDDIKARRVDICHHKVSPRDG